jgi:hypothetical protein
MGVQGLTLQLAKHSRPQLVTLVAGGGGAAATDAAKAAAGQVLLVDGASLEALLRCDSEPGMPRCLRGSPAA